ncbi:hypothetical protein H663_020570 [Limnohabitans planktonicus II-D5]|uniref:Uncharacterized protein n=1 Tax=Limnohabitans planktonicus II-D5 TaxID=1293045 RepID=A0A2T7SQA8_9BURK|nr:hypothetical protein H663_020570 [Limnohabitans planktonicus II-D5]
MLRLILKRRKIRSGKVLHFHLRKRQLRMTSLRHCWHERKLLDVAQIITRLHSQIQKLMQLDLLLRTTKLPLIKLYLDQISEIL